MAREYSLTPKAVPRIETKYRRIVTELPAPDSISSIEKLHCFEPIAMRGQPPILWDHAEGFQVFDKSGNCWIDWSSGVLITNAGHGRQEIIDAIVSMPGYVNYVGTISTLTEEEINSLPPLEIGKTEKIRFGSIRESLVFIANSIDEKKLNNQDIVLRLQYFKTELNDKVAIGIGSKMKLANTSEINRQITDLNLAIDKAQALLDEKLREAEPGFFTHVFAVMSPYPQGIYQFAKLHTLKYIIPLINQRDLLVEQVKQKDILAGTLLLLSTDLESLLLYVEGAIQSTSQLETLWISISEYINASQNKIMGMNDFLTLRSFVSSLRVVLKNWKTIQNNANALISAFE